jgi:hypothetical protein
MCSAVCGWRESRRTHTHALLSHLRLLGSIPVVSYDSQGLRWKYSNPPPRGEALFAVRTIQNTQTQPVPHRKHVVSTRVLA